jgi:predicted phosphate transport protein (TIGR00153 family)
MFITSPFEGLQEHAEKVKECAAVFQLAMECYFSDRCEKFEEIKQNIHTLEQEADAIKRRIRGHLPKGTMLPVDKFQLFRYLREQDKVLDAVEDCLDWISFKSELNIPEDIKKDILILVDAAMDPIEELSKMVAEARKYFRNFSEDQRRLVKDMIRTLRQQEHEADKLEDQIKQKAFNSIEDAVAVFHLVRLAEMIGSIVDHAENAGDMMRAMVAK